MIRLDKFLADLGIGSRSEVKKLLKYGRIKVNGEKEKDPSRKIDSDKDEVLYNGEKLVYQKYFYYMLNKPAGCVSATKDGLSKTVIEYLKNEPTRDLFPVGRLDKDTEGLLLITNDGQLAHRLLSPKKQVEKIYYAFVSQVLTESEIEKFKSGLDIGDETPTLAADISIISQEEAKLALTNSTIDLNSLNYKGIYKVKLKEGRYHQIKRMFQHFGSEVLYLKRLSMGSLNLDQDLQPGAYRKLTHEEVEQINS